MKSHAPAKCAVYPSPRGSHPIKANQRLKADPISRITFSPEIVLFTIYIYILPAW